MQGQRGAIGSLPESLGFEHGSGSSENSPVNGLSDFMSPANASDAFLNSSNQEGQNVSMWNVGEAGSSSGSSQVGSSRLEPRADRGWPALVKSCPEPHHFEPPASMLSVGDHGPSNVTVNPSTYVGFKASNSSSSSSSDPFELDGHRLSRKRKVVELTVGQSSSGGGGGSMWRHPVVGNPLVAGAQTSDRVIPRIGLGVGGVSSENPVAENTHRNIRLRISASGQQDPPPANSNTAQSNIAFPYPSLRLNPVDLRSPPLAATAENPATHLGQPVLRIPALRRHLQSTSRWCRNSRANRSSTIAIPGDRDELDSRTIPIPIPTNISDHPLFVQPNAVSNAGTGVAAPRPAANRGSPHYPPRRLSEFLRRSLLSATDSEAGGGLNPNVFPRIPPSVGTSASSSQDIGMPPGVSVPGHPLPHSRSSAFGFPYLSRSMAAGSEGRGRLFSEIRNVLDLMRRGEPLRFEDVMLLDQSVFYGVADIHDRHRDMRLDIDNMSYEELLALEERIGNVDTGLTEETVLKQLKLKQYVIMKDQPETEPCCICQEEYKEGDDLGALECGHDFHHGCIKQWLLHKNLCPICKSTAFAAK